MMVLIDVKHLSLQVSLKLFNSWIHGVAYIMAGRSPKNGPPASISPLQKDEILGFLVGPNETAHSAGISDDGNGAGVDHMPIARTLLPGSPFPLGSMHGTPCSLTQNIPVTDLDLMTGVPQFDSSQNSQVHHNFMDIGGQMPFINSPGPVFPYPEGNVNRIYKSDIYDNTRTANNAMSSASQLSSFQNPQIDQSFVTSRGNAAGGFQMTRQGGRKNSINIRRPRIKRNLVSHGTSIPVLYHTPDSGEIGIKDNIEAKSVQSDCLVKTDGSFLTLGIGDSMEATSKFNVPSREITSRSERNILPQLYTSHGQRANRSSLNLSHNKAGGFSCFQNNVGGFSSLAGNVGGLTLSHNDLGVRYGTNTGWNSSPSNSLRTPQLDIQHCMPMPSNRNLVLGGNGDARFANTDPCKGVPGYLPATSRPSNGSQGGLPDCGQGRLPGLMPESANTTRFTNQQSSNQLKECLMKSMGNFWPESSMISSYRGILGSHTGQYQSGPQFPAYQDSSTQAAEGGHFPQRIGVQTASNLGQHLETGPVQHSKDLLGPAFTTGQVIPVARGNGLAQASNVLVGPSLGRSATQPYSASPEALPGPVPSRKILRPTLTTCQVIPATQGNRLTQVSNVLVGPSLMNSSIQPIAASPVSFPSQCLLKIFFDPLFTTGQVIPLAKGNGPGQASRALVRPPLKRGAIQPMHAMPRVQCRRTIPQPFIIHLFHPQPRLLHPSI
ncbi:hypothetical protein L1049_004938 [Liquidambar formosana]|uniref:Uncharacterized protein n=1 Tax=Liquidambar formosana TaxID=63359 RepID=A0AAP0RP04_LIQFO